MVQLKTTEERHKDRQGYRRLIIAGEVENPYKPDPEFKLPFIHNHAISLHPDGTISDPNFDERVDNMQEVCYICNEVLTIEDFDDPEEELCNQCFFSLQLPEYDNVDEFELSLEM